MTLQKCPGLWSVFAEDEQLLSLLVRLVQQHRDLLFQPCSDAVGFSLRPEHRGCEGPPGTEGIIVYVLLFLTLSFLSLPPSRSSLCFSSCQVTASSVLPIV